MARILIDTDELRRLASSYDGAAGGSTGVGHRFASALASTSLNDSDPGVRGARVHERSNLLRRDLDRLAQDWRSEANEFRALASRVESSESTGWAGALDLIRPFDWLSAGGGISGALVGGLFAGLTGFTLPGDALAGLREAGANALNGVRDTVSAGLEAGRSTFDRGLGLVTDAAGRLGRAVDSFGDRVQSLLASAWNGIWDRVTALFQAVLEGMSRLVAVTATFIENAVEGAIRVGHWVMDMTAAGLVLVWEHVLEAAVADLLIRLSRVPFLTEFVSFAVNHLDVFVLTVLGLLTLPFGLSVVLPELSKRAVRLPSGRAIRQPDSTLAGDRRFEEFLQPGVPLEPSDYARIIDRLQPGEIVVHELGGQPPRYVILMRGLDLASLGPHGIQSTLAAQADQNSELVIALQRLLDSLPPDAQVGLIGHSLGGIASAQASRDPRITHLIAIGSPVDGVVSPNVRTLNLADVSDPIEQLDHGDRTGRAPSDHFIDVDFSNSTADGFGAHGIKNYIPVLDALQGGALPGNIDLLHSDQVDAARRYLDDFDRLYGSGGIGPNNGLVLYDID